VEGKKKGLGQKGAIRSGQSKGQKCSPEKKKKERVRQEERHGCKRRAKEEQTEPRTTCL